MKILIASDAYVFQTSGVANVVIVLADGLRQLGHDVRVLAPANERRSYINGNDYFIRSVPTFLYPDVRLCPVRHDPLIDSLKCWKPDLIHLHTEASIARMAYDIAEATSAPMVITTHTDYAHYAFGRFRNTLPVRLFMRSCGKRLYRRAEAVVVPSEKARGFALVQAACDRVTVIPNGIRLERFQRPVIAKDRASLLRQFGLSDNGYILVMVTRISREKNIMEILEYFPVLLRVLPEAQLLIVGEGPDRKRLESFVTEQGLSGHVRFAGRIDPDEVYRYYALGNVFVSASTFEVHSISFLEAMACGLPLVCREDASLQGVLDDGENGIIYRTKDEFVTAIVRILRDDLLQENMRVKALDKAQEYSDERFVGRTLALYKRVLGS